jgi:hypothetical protein
VDIVALTSVAREAGLIPATFRVASNKPKTERLEVIFYVSGGSATVSDYQIEDSNASPGPAVIAISATSSEVFYVRPRRDNLIEGTETVVISLAAGSGYKLGTQTSITVSIRDRVGVKTIFATAGVKNISGEGRDIGGKDLFLTQLDCIAVRAIPQDNGDLDPDDLEWIIPQTVSSYGDPHGIEKTLSFDTYATAYHIAVTTPLNTGFVPFRAFVTPIPTGVAFTEIEMPIATLQPNYGTKFRLYVTASAGADAFLRFHNSSSDPSSPKFQIFEEYTHVAGEDNPTQATIVPSYDRIASGDYILDTIATPLLGLSTWGHHDLYWVSQAQDSLRQGVEHKQRFASFESSAVKEGTTVITTYNGVPFKQKAGTFEVIP